MNQEKIGKFILERRKEKKLTQSELAEKLGVTDKSISNWENGRNMPDLSLFKPLCDILEITINDLISGEIIAKEIYQEKFEENIISTIDYSSKKLNNKNSLIGSVFIIFGIIMAITAMTIFPSESSFGSIYSILGGIISLIGVSRFTKKLSYAKRLVFNFGYFAIFVLILFILDFISVNTMHQSPRFSYLKEYSENMIIYKTPFYNVYRINANTDQEYYIIDKDKKYTEQTVPVTPFNRTKSGINNIIKYKKKYIGNNSNIGNLISNLPLSKFGYVFEIDSNNLGLIINYHITDWYIKDNLYLQRSLIYNSVSIFALIDNVKDITYNFTGKTYKVNRNQIIEMFPNYDSIIKDGIDKDNFNKYLENNISNDEFVNNIFKKIFED